ncbi:type VI secretion system contractile sheath large subunit [Sorangium sp. So ce1099]|uniref:type VI secretion system contractile sheath large subunit n=1 Tax=Sorangium sp. So ce1099 TaxID=3133331 RepID=UPI003F64862F
MTKPIQDKIYRSRLTIAYRTNIDGVPVPQKLPLRLLVLGDLTGRKSRPSGNRGSGVAELEGRMIPAIEDRSVISVKHGMNIARVIADAGITIPIPTPSAAKAAKHATLSEGSVIHGKLVSSKLVARVDDIDPEGKCPIAGEVPFTARAHDNGAIEINGPVRVEGSLTFTAEVDRATAINLSGTFRAPIGGKLDFANPTLEPTSNGKAHILKLNLAQAELKNKALVPAAMWKDDWSGGATWITGAIERQQIEGTITPDDSKNMTGTLKAGGILEVTVGAQSVQQTYELVVNDADTSIPVVNAAERRLQSKQITLEVTNKRRPTCELGDAATSPLSGVDPQVAFTVEGDKLTINDANSIKLVIENPTVTGLVELEGKLNGTLAKDKDAADKFTGKATLTASGFEHEVVLSANVAPSDGSPITKLVLTASGKVTRFADVEAQSRSSDVKSFTTTNDKVSVVLGGSIGFKLQGGQRELFGDLNGSLEKHLSEFEVGSTDVEGDVTIRTQDEGTFTVHLKAAVNVVAGKPEWRLKDAAKVTLTAAGTVDIPVSVQRSIGEICRAIQIAKGGALDAELSDAPFDLTGKSGSNEFKPPGRLSGKLLANLRSVNKNGFVKVKLLFKGPNKTTCDLSCDLPVRVNADRATINVFGRVKNAQKDGRQDLVTADVLDTGRELTGLMTEIHEDGAIDVTIAGDQSARRTIPIMSLDSFSPDAVAAGVPEIRRLQIIAALLNELRSTVNLYPGVRKALNDALVTCDDHLPILHKQLEERYASLVLPPSIRFGAARPQASEFLVGKRLTQQQNWYKQDYHKLQEDIFRSMDIGAWPEKPEQAEDERAKLALVRPDPAVTPPPNGAPQLAFYERDAGESQVPDRARLLNGIAALVLNSTEVNPSKMTVAEQIGAITARINDLVREHLDFVMGHHTFRRLERNWREIAELCSQVETDEVIIDLFDASKGELEVDLDDHANDIFTSLLFRRIYVDEYDRFGGRPFGAMIGLYRFDSGEPDLKWLKTMSEIANASHCPFIASAKPKFFGTTIDRWSALDSIGDIEAHLKLPKFGKWDEFRDSMEAPYVGLTLPGYLLRRPWSADEDQLGNRAIKHNEQIKDSATDYLWGHSAVLFARNMIRSFENSKWCQYIRGVKGGGEVKGLKVHTIKRHGKEEVQPPVEFEIADYRELQFAKAGLIPLVHRKGTADACFFSAQSIKKSRDFLDQVDTQNAHLVTNLAYTLSVTRIAHYVKKMMRDYIGSTADPAYIQNTLQIWLNDYVTTTVNPDDLTLRYYPFKAVNVEVVNKPGPLGWYKGTIKILPHIQFEGMDVELQLEAALGGGK